MKKIKRIIMIALVLCMSIPTYIHNVKADDTYTISYDVNWLQSDARKELNLINVFRTGDSAWYWNSDNTTKTICTNLDALEWDYNLEKIAMQRCVEIAISYSHTRPDNSSTWTAHSEANYTIHSAGENIAAGQTSYQNVFNAWKEDNYQYSGQGHRRNMLSSSYKYVACAGLYYNGTYYWVQEFSNSTSANSSFVSAIDGVQTVSAVIAASNIKNVRFMVDDTEVNVKAGSIVAIPEITTSITLLNTWSNGSSYLPIHNPTYSYKILDTNIATISGNKIRGLREGTTTLRVSALGYIADFTINVESSECTHNYIATITKEPTETSTGIRTYTCSKCGNSYQEDIPVLTHTHTTVVDKAVEATCTTSGLSEGSHCSKCNEVIQNQTVIPALGHNYIAQIIAPTQEAQGYTLHTCMRCGASYKDQYTDYKEDVEVIPSTDYVLLEPNQTATIYFTITDSFEGKIVVISLDDASCIESSWGKWNGNQLSLDIYGIYEGEALLDVLLVDTDENVVAETYVTVEVKNINLPFSDVPQGKWYTSYIKEVYSKGLMTGKTATLFGPNENLTRGQLATILYRMSGENVAYKAKFNDVPANKFYSEAITWAYLNGIVTGYEADNTFKPGDNITRQDLALMLQRYAKYQGLDVSADLTVLKDYPDLRSVSGYAKNAVAWAVENGLISGDKGNLNPKGNATRAQTAKMISVTDRVINR